jgi:hypothetical protein
VDGLCDVPDEAQRRSEREATKPNICDVGLCIEIDAQKHMGAWPDRAIGDIPQCPGSEARHMEAEFPQHVTEEQVVFEAVAAAPGVNELALERGQVELDRSSAQRVEILEGNRLRMVQMQSAQGFECCCPRAVLVADTREVGA